MVSLLRNNLAWLLLSLLLSTSLWVFVTFQRNPEVTNTIGSVPLDIKDYPKSVVVQTETTTVQVQVSAPADVWPQLKVDKFLAEAGTALASSLDYHLTLTKVAELAVPFFADWCGVNIADDSGVMRRLVLRHAGVHMEVARDLQKLFPTSRNPAARLAVRTRKAQFVADVSDSLLA